MSTIDNQTKGRDVAGNHQSPSEALLISLSRMQECEDTRQFCRVTLQELCRVFPDISHAAFLQIPGRNYEIEVSAVEGRQSLSAEEILADFSTVISESLETSDIVVHQNRLAIPFVRGPDIPAVIVIQCADGFVWSSAQRKLFKQFSENGARGLETTALLQEARLLAYHDVLTSLGNRLSFKKEIQAEIALLQHGETERFAVVQFVLDDLPELNIALGHSSGDELLRSAAEQLDRLFPDAIALARTSGDGFGVCTPITTNDQIALLPDLVNDLFDVYLPEELNLPHLVPRIGISLYPMDGGTSDQLWRNTNIALANTKKPGSPNFCYYDNHIETEILGRVTLNNALREGMTSGQLSLSYQPQIDLETGGMTGVEALLRWEREKGKFVPANTFIPIAEASGLLGPISEWVLREACEQRQRWSEQGVPEFPVAVNISLAEFQSDEFVPLVKQVLFETGIPAALLDIELTESVIMRDRGQTKRNMIRLKGIGVRLSIDDFGTGYSSLSYLTHLPASVLKIDKCFVDGVVVNSKDAAIANTIISLGKNLGMEVLAEGVENIEQVEFLKQAGCHQAQGYVFSRPVSAEQIVELAEKIF
ncbi:putative bifunctional diguanylate cyclase/phosphodiesterase [Sneathiella aquimaris]|uniref:putative bifunctional diguanylate cyclase/phosphodiesterase n=1 Tax=Sneathiella aquimaris TaxID=2599305 RepID=UPI00146F8A73|nr:bifunctional diguanylate cyclase/phosphodiesterase [Sneathiella aquimaris]